MTDIRISDADARAIAGSHGDAATVIENTAPSIPSVIDGGLASQVLGSIASRLIHDADTLALANRGTGNLMTSVADDLFTTDEAVTAQFAQLNKQFVR